MNTGLNPFQKFGIGHLSPSSLNCWLASPGVWSLRYLAGVRDNGSPAAWRGTAVEAGLHRLLLGADLKEAQAVALADFDARAAGEVSDAITKERSLINDMLGQASLWIVNTNHSDDLAIAATQLKVETRLDGVSVPVIGYLDFTFMDEGAADIDCKTTKACPSKPKPDHVRQLALYWQARQRPQSLLYITDKKFAHYTVPEADLRQGIAELTRAAQSLERFLSIAPDADTAIRALPMDRDHFTWSPTYDSKLAELQEAF